MLLWSEVRVELDTPDQCVPLGLLPEQEQEGEPASHPSLKPTKGIHMVQDLRIENYLIKAELSL